jgi:CSLREA domain-containing protein
MLAILLTLAALGLSVPPAFAATITVTTTNDTIAGGDGCSLREAIANANGNDQSGSAECTAGQGGGTIDTIAFNIPAATDAGCNAGTGVCTITPAVGAIVFPRSRTR